MKKDQLSDEDLEKALNQALDSFGTAETMWHQDYGFIIYEGKVTEAGEQFRRDLKIDAVEDV